MIVKGRASKDDPSVIPYWAGWRHHRPPPQADGKHRVDAGNICPPRRSPQAGGSDGRNNLEVIHTVCIGDTTPVETANPGDWSSNHG